MRINEIIIEADAVEKTKLPAETITSLLTQEVIDKIGQPRNPAYRSVNVDAVVQKAKPYYMQPTISKGLAVDKAFDDIYPNLERPSTKKSPKASAQQTATAGSKTDQLRKDAMGRTLRHQRYYGAKDVQDKTPSDTTGIDQSVADIVQKGKDIAYATIPGAEELGKAASLAKSSFNKGKSVKLPSNKGKSTYKRRQR